MMLGLVLLAYFVGPPHLGKPPDPSIIQADPRPDWYLLWYFAVLALMPHWLENYFMILAPLVAGLSSSFVLPFVFNKGERTPRRVPGQLPWWLMVVLMIGSFWYEGIEIAVVAELQRPTLARESGRDRNRSGGRRRAIVSTTKAVSIVTSSRGYGGRRGPNLTNIGNQLTGSDMVIRIMNGGVNMPAYANNMKPQELDDVVAFLQSRKKP